MWLTDYHDPVIATRAIMESHFTISEGPPQELRNLTPFGLWLREKIIASLPDIKRTIGPYGDIRWSWRNSYAYRSGHGKWVAVVVGRIEWWGDSHTGHTINFFIRSRPTQIIEIATDTD